MPLAGSPLRDLEFLVQAATGARRAVARERVQVLWGGYGEIRRFELEAGPASSVMVKHVEPPRFDGAEGEQARSHARKLRSYQVERAFYLGFGAGCEAACRVPQAYHAAQTGHGFLFVLEDLDAAGFRLRRSTPTPAEMARCLDWLAHFHARFLRVAPDGLFAEGTYWHLETRPDELARLADPALRGAATELDARLSGARFRTILHGDAKVDNFCFAPGGPVAAVDFQYAGGGVGVKDVAYFLVTCLDDAACAGRAEDLLDGYFATLVRALPPGIDAEALVAEWRALYPLACADFMRFLLGWAPDEARAYPHGLRLTREVLATLSAPRRPPRSS